MHDSQVGLGSLSLLLKIVSTILFISFFFSKLLLSLLPADSFAECRYWRNAKAGVAKVLNWHDGAVKERRGSMPPSFTVISQSAVDKLSLFVYLRCRAYLKACILSQECRTSPGIYFSSLPLHVVHSPLPHKNASNRVSRGQKLRSHDPRKQRGHTKSLTWPVCTHDGGFGWGHIGLVESRHCR